MLGTRIRLYRGLGALQRVCDRRRHRHALRQTAPESNAHVQVASLCARSSWVQSPELWLRWLPGCLLPLLARPMASLIFFSLARAPQNACFRSTRPTRCVVAWTYRQKSRRLRTGMSSVSRTRKSPWKEVRQRVQSNSVANMPAHLIGLVGAHLHTGDVSLAPEPRSWRDFVPFRVEYAQAPDAVDLAG